MKSIFRANDWWQGKAALLMGMVYLFTAWFAIPFARFVNLSLLSILTICGFASLGYLLNDLFDMEKDLLAGKPNTLQGKSVPYIITLFAIATTALFFPWFYLPSTRFSIFLIALEIGLFIAYSLPPFRLKERGVVGIFTDALYAHSLPVLLAAYTFMLASGAKVSPWLLGLLIFFQTVSGIRNILIHQYNDKGADLISGTYSFYATIKIEIFYRMLFACIFLELLGGLIFYLIIPADYIVVATCTLVILFCSLFAILNFRNKGMVGLLSSTWKYFPNNVFEKWVPVALLLALSFSNSCFAIIAVLHLTLFNYKFFVEVYHHGVVPARDGSRNQFVKMMIAIRAMFSFTINNIIYYGFLFFNVDLKKENISAMEYWRRQRKTKAR